MKKDLKITYPNSEKVYLNGIIHPSVKVGMRLVKQMPTVSIKDGERIETPNPSIYIYDTSGPYGDDNGRIDLEKGLPRLREQWIKQRMTEDANNVCQMYYAKKGIITYISISNDALSFYLLNISCLPSALQLLLQSSLPSSRYLRLSRNERTSSMKALNL